MEILRVFTTDPDYPQNRVLVHFVDIGKKEEKPKNELLELPASFATRPYQVTLEFVACCHTFAIQFYFRLLRHEQSQIFILLSRLNFHEEKHQFKEKANI